MNLKSALRGIRELFFGKYDEPTLFGGSRYGKSSVPLALMPLDEGAITQKEALARVAERWGPEYEASYRDRVAQDERWEKRDQGQPVIVLEPKDLLNEPVRTTHYNWGIDLAKDGSKDFTVVHTANANIPIWPPDDYHPQDVYEEFPGQGALKRSRKPKKAKAQKGATPAPKKVPKGKRRAQAKPKASSGAKGRGKKQRER